MAIPFLVETGEGIPNSNSYMTIQELKDFSDVFMRNYDPYLDEDIEKGLIQATLFLDSYFYGRFPGDRKENQGLEWPRENASYYDGEEIADDVIPKELKHALMEAFYIVKSGVDFQPAIAGNGILSAERVKVDVIEEEKKYNSSTFPKRTTYSVLEDAMSRVTGGMNNRRLKIERVGGYT